MGSLHSVGQNKSIEPALIFLNMKRKLSLMALLLSCILLFSACQDEENKIIGTWNMDIYASTSGGESFASLGCKKIQYTFYEGGLFYHYWNYTSGSNSEYSVYSVDDNCLVLDGFPHTIEQLTNKKLIIKSNYGFGDIREVFNKE